MDEKELEKLNEEFDKLLPALLFLAEELERQRELMEQLPVEGEIH